MTTGHPASASRARWTRERLIGLGLGADQIVLSECTLPSLRNESDLAPAHYRPEFAPLVQRLSRLLGTGRGISLYVTGGRDSTATRVHAALQIAAGLAPLGRQVVLADTEFLRPGLEGLLAEPLAEGILDMVRFGRSSRALLLRPVPEGPWLLPSGSIPADDAAPLDVEALRSVAYRISQICDLALYVGPLPARDDLHPMARVCDHVLLASDESMVAPSEIVDALAGLQAQHVHVLGAVLVAPAVDATSIPAMSAPPLPPVVPPL
jgi:Mrp family chromosome partitioning ATPase